MATYAIRENSSGSTSGGEDQRPIHLVHSAKLPPIVPLIETVQALKEAYRPHTQQERDLLMNWPGWGAYRQAFELEPNEKWRAVGPQIRQLLGPEGYDLASAAITTSFFTSPFISQGIWRLAEQLGFTGGAVLEPGCGTGQILSYAPPSWQMKITGIEQEPFTASIAQLLFPHAHILTAPLQNVALVDEAFDLVVGNVPFADVAIYDRAVEDRLSLHNYVIYRSLAALRPGGLAILVTSRYTMDAATTRERAKISPLGSLIGAIRFPSYAFKWAKTAVITDLLIFQRKGTGISWKGNDWLDLESLTLSDASIPMNEYFCRHPEQILGTASLGRGMYRDNELIITAPDDLENAMNGAIARILLDAASHECCYIPSIDRSQLPPHVAKMRGEGLKEGCFYLLPEDGLVQIVDGQPKAVTRYVAELSGLVRVRDAALGLLEAERDYTQTDEALMPQRRELNRCYDAYVQSYGLVCRSTFRKRIDKKSGEEHISRHLSPALQALRNDEHFPLLLGLESYDDETGTAQKAPIFSRRVNRPVPYKETAESREEAIALSLDRYGHINIPFISRVTGLPEGEVAAYLGDLVYEDPETQVCQYAPIYLSGNVRRKLEIAGKALSSDSKWQRNVDALENVQPDPIAPEDIKVLLGAPWVPVPYIVQFCLELLRMKPEIVRDKYSGVWDVAQPLGAQSSALATSTWGTTRVNAFRLIGHILNHKPTIVEDETADGKTYTNTEETMLAQQKKKEIQIRFSEWIWEDHARTKELSTLYNKIYNGVVPSNFAGDHLSFPGMDPYWQEHLYSWQKDFIARMINSRSGLCAYPVGSGKTKIQVAGGMTLRRMQLISKAAILVPNHLLEQIASEAKQLYPGANILMISRRDLSRENRRIFMARIATGDHDLIVMTHSAFEAIDVHPETKRAYIRKQIKEHRQILCSIDEQSENNADKRQIKRIEKQIQRMQERLSERLDTEHDAGLTFEQLGISYLIVDEAHFFKNLGLPTNQEKLQVTPSQRAQDMLMKLRWLEKQNEGRPFVSFFTATPISNSMVEAFVMLWYLNHPLLEDYQLASVDDFASMYIETESKIEVTPNGAGFRLYERPSNFINLPEFIHLFASVADIRPPDILAENRPTRLEHTISVEPTEEVTDYVNSLVYRSERLRNGDPLFINGKEDNMLWVTTDGRKAALWMGLHGIHEDYPAKLDAIATQMAIVYHRWQEKAAYLSGPYKSLQIGFCDMGTPNEKKGDQVYGEIKRLLVEKGVPVQAVRFIHEVSGSDAAKAALFEQCRTGEVAILLGSTAKLGTGTNIQTRCAAIHHCDAPWRPDEVEQREGRGQRPGNLYPVVEIFYYVQKRTFDAYSWQILANKAKFFNQLRSTTVMSREMAYSDDSALTYGQVKAAATGDVLLLEHANVSLSADAFSRLHTSFERARDRDKQEAYYLRKEAERLQESLGRYQQIEEQVTSSEQEHPFQTPDLQFLQKKEERRDFIANEVVQAEKVKAEYHLIGYWRSVPIYFKVNVHSVTPYVFSMLDPTHGCEVPCFAQWFEEDNQWRFAWKIEQFFEVLASVIEERERLLTSKCEKAQEYEDQAQTLFPQREAWQVALTRKHQLDDYIRLAAKATTEADLQKLAQMRQELLDTMSQVTVERPKPKDAATFVLPPRDPNAGVSSERIEVMQQAVQEPTIEQVAREIQERMGDPWAEPIVAQAEPDPWAALRQQYGGATKRKNRRSR